MNFFRLSYWFESLPTPFMPWVLQVVVITFVALTVVGVVLHLIVRRRREHRMWREGIGPLAAIIFQTGVIGLLLTWFTQDQIQFFGVRFWFLVLAVWMAVRLVYALKRIFKDIPAKMAERDEQDRIQKYLPH